MADTLNTILDSLRLLGDFARGYDPTYDARFPATLALVTILSGFRDLILTLLGK